MANYVRSCELLKDAPPWVGYERLSRPNTLLMEYHDGISAIRYYHTDIIKYSSITGKTSLFISEWFTKSTINHINYYLNNPPSRLGILYFHQGCRIYIKNYRVYLSTPTGTSLYYDGVILKQGVIQGEIKKRDAKWEDIINRINKYVRDIDCVIAPCPEDCFVCRFDGFGTNIDHLLSHILKDHHHGSLYTNTIKYCGYRSHIYDIDTLKRCVKSYLVGELLHINRKPL